MNSEQTVDQKTDSATQLLRLYGFRPLFGEELRARIADGARCVRFEFVISLLFVTLRRQSPVYLTHSWQERYVRGAGFSFLALLLGPWGVPWGLLQTPRAIWANLTGGVDCTQEVLAWLDAPGTDCPDSLASHPHTPTGLV
jgi:hypothetical protein